jgi:hypothetical protein
MRKLQFYKPQKTGAGACISFQYTNNQEDDRKNGFYVNIIKQAGWDDKSKTGSFKENVGNPEKHRNVKLTETEVSNLILVLDSNGKSKFSTVHVNGDRKTPIFFEPYLRSEVFVGHLFKIDKLSIALNMAESVTLKQYCLSALNTSFQDSK